MTGGDLERGTLPEKLEVCVSENKFQHCHLLTMGPRKTYFLCISISSSVQWDNNNAPHDVRYNE